MSQKTALQQMLEFTQTQIDTLKSVEQDTDNATVVLRFLKRQREVLQSLLPYERECIEGACNYGYHKGADREETRNSIKDYFTNTYKQ